MSRVVLAGAGTGRPGRCPLGTPRAFGASGQGGRRPLRTRARPAGFMVAGSFVVFRASGPPGWPGAPNCRTAACLTPISATVHSAPRRSTPVMLSSSLTLFKPNRTVTRGSVSTCRPQQPPERFGRQPRLSLKGGHIAYSCRAETREANETTVNARLGHRSPASRGARDRAGSDARRTYLSARPLSGERGDQPVNLARMLLDGSSRKSSLAGSFPR